MRNEILRRRVRSLQMMQASQQAALRDVAWSLRLLYRHVLHAGGGGRGVSRHLDRDRLSPPERAPARTRGQRRDPALRPHRDGYLMNAPATSDEQPRRRRWLVALPLIGFL